MRSYLDFEKPVAEIEAKVDELRALETGDSAAAIGEEIGRLEAKAAQTLKDLYASLTPWQKTLVARHHEAGVGRDAGDASAVVLGGGRHAGHVCAVAGVVLSRPVTRAGISPFPTRTELPD